MGDRGRHLQEKAVDQYEEVRQEHDALKTEVQEYAKEIARDPEPLPATQMLHLIREMREKKMYDRLRSLLKERVKRIILYTRNDREGRRAPYLKIETWLPSKPTESTPQSLQKETLLRTNLILQTRRC